MEKIKDKGINVIIENKLTKVGYKNLGNDKSISKLVLQILKNKNIRYLKTIPFLIYKYNFKMGEMDTESTIFFIIITKITKQIFKELGIKQKAPEYRIVKPTNISAYIKKELINYQDFKDEFELQLRSEIKPSLLIDKQNIYAERDLQMSLSILFTSKEKEIIKMMVNDISVSKTDYEYYSRNIKKKFQSIINLQEFAKTFYTRVPQIRKVKIKK